MMVSKYFVPTLNGTGLDLMLCAHIHKYRFNDANTIGADFPVLCNANRQRIDAVVDKDGIRLDFFDETGAKIKSMKFGKKK